MSWFVLSLLPLLPFLRGTYWPFSVQIRTWPMIIRIHTTCSRWCQTFTKQTNSYFTNQTTVQATISIILLSPILLAFWSGIDSSSILRTLSECSYPQERPEYEFYIHIVYRMRYAQQILYTRTQQILISNLIVEISFSYSFWGNCFSYSVSLPPESFQYRYPPRWIPFYGHILFVTILTAIDTGRVPFDITEAESELIAGITNENSGLDFPSYFIGVFNDS